MRKAEGVYIHDENAVFVKKDPRRCNLCNDEMWVFCDSKGRHWRFCMNSPAECGLVFPHNSNSNAWGNVVAVLLALRMQALLERRPHLTVPELVALRVAMQSES